MPDAQKVFSTILLSDSISKWVHGQHTGYNLLKQFHAVTYPGCFQLLVTMATHGHMPFQCLHC